MSAPYSVHPGFVVRPDCHSRAGLVRRAEIQASDAERLLLADHGFDALGGPREVTEARVGERGRASDVVRCGADLELGARAERRFAKGQSLLRRTQRRERLDEAGGGRRIRWQRSRFVCSVGSGALERDLVLAPRCFEVAADPLEVSDRHVPVRYPARVLGGERLDPVDHLLQTGEVARQGVRVHLDHERAREHLPRARRDLEALCSAAEALRALPVALLQAHDLLDVQGVDLLELIALEQLGPLRCRGQPHLRLDRADAGRDGMADDVQGLDLVGRHVAEPLEHVLPAFSRFLRLRVRARLARGHRVVQDGVDARGERRERLEQRRERLDQSDVLARANRLRSRSRRSGRGADRLVGPIDALMFGQRGVARVGLGERASAPLGGIGRRPRRRPTRRTPSPA